MASPQTLSDSDRRLVAGWAADCAERVLGVFEAEAPDGHRPRALIARARAFAAGELSTAEEIRRRFAGGVGPGEVKAPAAIAAARAAGQAVGVCHMGAHALGAAAYAALAAGLADPDRSEAVEAKPVGNWGTCRRRFGSPCELCRQSARTRPVPSARGCSHRVPSAPSFVIFKAGSLVDRQVVASAQRSGNSAGSRSTSSIAALSCRAQTLQGTRPTPVPSPGKATVRDVVADRLASLWFRDRTGRR